MDIIARTDIQAFQDERVKFLLTDTENTTILDTVTTPRRYSNGERMKDTTGLLWYSYVLETCTSVIYVPAQGAGGPTPGSTARF